jgi:hypothetical protein
VKKSLWRELTVAAGNHYVRLLDNSPLKRSLSGAKGNSVWVRRQWNDHRIARYSLENVRNPHWSDISGGICAKTGRSLLHVRVMCDAMEEGELAHSHTHEDEPHEIKVCVLKTDNDPEVYAALSEQAGPRPAAEPLSLVAERTHRHSFDSFPLYDSMSFNVVQVRRTNSQIIGICHSCCPIRHIRSMIR